MGKVPGQLLKSVGINLLKYDYLVWKNIEDQIASALTGTGIKNSTARSIAYWLTKVAEWFF
ncbi:hypothetical protein GsuE55_35090 [Geobacillus subterraneus]|uniref:Uncharacterized protein n=1 Tax=Geobacillus subterraneus TaxID=129338 RepID=A0A679FY71_9BACL|nr:hypothetical protein GsuE55_35090 [Geobacillus subterraneus]